MCTCVARSYNSQVNGLACPPMGMPRYSRLNASSPIASRSSSKNFGSYWIVSAVAFSLIHDGSSLSQAIQNGSVRLQAVDSMAKRASGRRARIGRKAAIRSLESLAASSATIQASTVSPRMESSLPGSAITREPFVSSSVKVLSASSPPPALMTASRTRRTASALWRCAGQATTLSEPGENKAACAIPQAAVVVLPHWRAVSARIEAPRGALKKSSCHFVGSTPTMSRTHSAGSTRYATSLRLFMIDLQKCLRDSSFQFWLVVEALDYALDDLREIEIDV